MVFLDRHACDDGQTLRLSCQIDNVTSPLQTLINISYQYVGVCEVGDAQDPETWTQLGPDLATISQVLEVESGAIREVVFYVPG